jgi:hypothetical protein
MALLDPIVNAVAALIGFATDVRDDLNEDPAEDVVDAVAFLRNPGSVFRQRFADWLVANDLSDEVGAIDSVPEVLLGGIIDTFEDDVIEELQQADLSNLEGLEPRLDEAEGAAAEDALTAISSGSALEILSAGQVDQQQEYIIQVLSFLGLEDVLGARLQMWFEQGLAPALEARVGKQARSEFVSLPDAVEYALRNKQSDEGWLQGQSAPQDTVDVIGSNNPVNPNNLVEEWGIRDDQLEILERVSLDAVEIEELIESPVQFGVVPTVDEANDVLQISGLPESTKGLFRRTIEQAPRAADLWEQRTTTEELVGQLDDLVIDGTITPDQALQQLPEEIDEARPALGDRWEILAAVPAGTPSQTDFEGALAYGGLSPAAFREQLDDSEFPIREFPSVVDATIIDEADGDLRTGVGLGLLPEADYVGLLTDAGLDEATIDRLLRGEDLDDIATSRLTDETRAEGGGLQTIPQIGGERSRMLREIDVATVEQLAAANPEQVADALVTSESFAAQIINAARIRTGQEEP